MKFSSILIPIALFCTLPLVFSFRLKGDALGADRPILTAHYLLNEADLYSQRGFSLLADIRQVDLVSLSKDPEEFPKLGQALKGLFRDLHTDHSKFAVELDIRTDHVAKIYAVEVVDDAIESAFQSEQGESVIRPELLRLFFECLYDSQLGMMGNFQLLYMFVHFGAGPFALQDVAQFTWPPREMSIIAQSFAHPAAPKRFFGLNSVFELSRLLWSNLKTKESQSLVYEVLGRVISDSVTTTMAEVKLILSGRPFPAEPLDAPFALMRAFYRPDPYLMYNSGTPVEAQVKNGHFTITSRTSTTPSGTTVSGPILFSKPVDQITLGDIAELERLGFDCKRHEDIMSITRDKEYL